MTLGRNELCHCGSGRKYKRCCFASERAAESKHLPEHRPFTTAIDPELERLCDEALEKLEGGDTLAPTSLGDMLISSFPGYYKINFLIGTILCVEEKIEEAIPYLKKSVELFPSFAQGYFNLGLAYQKNVMIREAVENFRIAVRITKGKGEVGEQAQECIDDLENMIRKFDGISLDLYLESQDYFNKGFEHLKEKRFEEAIALFQKALEINPTNVQSYGNLALAYAGLGRKALALENFDKAIELDPKYEPAILNRAIMEDMEDGTPSVGRVREIEYYRDYGKGKKSYTKEMLEIWSGDASATEDKRVSVTHTGEVDHDARI